MKARAAGHTQPPQQHEEFEKLLTEAKRLYLEEMDNEASLEILERAESLAQTQKQRADVHFYLSLVYYALWGRGGSDNFAEIMRNITLIDESIRKLITFDYYREMDRRLCPPKYLEAFEEVKKEYGVLKIQSSPAGADVSLGESTAVIGQPPLTIGHREGNVKVKVKIGKREKQSVLHVTAGQETGSPPYSLKKRSGLFYWLGGTVLAGGTAALLLFKKKEQPGQPLGTVQVYSTPQGAAVFLDDANTGHTTNCTINNIPVGTYEVKLVKEGYRDESRTVTVEDGQIATINVSLTRYKLKILQPNADDVWINGETVEILWETDEETEGKTASSLNATGILNNRVGDFHPARINFQTEGATFNTEFDGDKNLARRSITGKNSSGIGPIPLNNPSPFSQNQKILVFRKDRLSGFVNPPSAINSRWNRRNPPLPGIVKTQALSNVKIELYKGISLVETTQSRLKTQGPIHSWSQNFCLRGWTTR